MPEIQVLDSHIADLIAAGEVVERPASVVKELMENAIDAGATQVTVEIEHGGMRYIRVTDNGCGMAEHQLATAFLRHATSKLRTAYDLEAIGTLGFRGEALAAIAAVARVEVISRTEHQDFGSALSLEGGQVVSQEEAGGAVGTTMLVRDLFFNTPARLKFMKKDSAEGAAVFATVQRLAMAHPEVSVRFIRDGKQDLSTPGDGSLKSAVYGVLGRDLALGLLEVKASGEEGAKVTGLVSLPACCRASRNYQFFFVNGRYVKSRILMAALEQAYANLRMVGKFPACVLHLTTRLNGVDVNVHPAKTEIKFVSEKKMFDLVYQGVLETLTASTSHPVAVLQPEKPVTQNSPPPQQMELTAPLTATEGQEPVTKKKQALPVKPGLSLVDRIGRGSLRLEDVAQPKLNQSKPAKELEQVSEPNVETRTQPASATQPQPSIAEQPEPIPEPTPVPEPISVEGESQQVASEPVQEIQPWKVKGELFNTYILVEQGETSFVIDKHAAHERMNFDQLKAVGYVPMVQQLLVPVTFVPSPEEGAVLLDQQELLEAFGFELEDFGGGTLLVRQAPDYVDAPAIPDTLVELAAQLLSNQSQPDPTACRDHLMATMACKAAIKGGQKNDVLELERVAEAVLSGQVKYCPHGRPVAVELSKKRLESLFKRA